VDLHGYFFGVSDWMAGVKHSGFYGVIPRYEMRLRLKWWMVAAFTEAEMKEVRYDKTEGERYGYKENCRHRRIRYTDMYMYTEDDCL